MKVGKDQYIMLRIVIARLISSRRTKISFKMHFYILVFFYFLLNLKLPFNVGLDLCRLGFFHSYMIVWFPEYFSICSGVRLFFNELNRNILKY